ncbi:MAG: 1,6-anhydro-N-acetylmuramyl-L-alanine amidase AmpD [Nevskiales bacterium]
MPQAAGSTPLVIRAGKLSGVRFAASPNFDERPPGTVVDLLVVHGISLPPGAFGSGWIEDLFLNRLDPAAHPYFAQVHQNKVSAHLLIRRGGETIQFVSFDKRAWHAGASVFEGRSACNDFSIGIELEGTDDTPYEPVQYAQLAAVAGTLMQAFPNITKQRIVGHSYIAPGRKTDPGPAFDWTYWRSLLQERV